MSFRIARRNMRPLCAGRKRAGGVRPAKAGKGSGMHATGDWPGAAADFLERNLPALDDGSGWQDMAVTACQIGCEALVALGRADATGWGASRRAAPRRPAMPPRWDDLCVAVLGLARQQGQLAYRLPDGSPQPERAGDFIIRRIGAPSPPPPNIAAAHGLGPALARSELLALLDRLGLVADGAWTPAAEPVLWRVQPGAWGMRIEADPRFRRAVEAAVATLPAGVRAEMDRLVTITDEDVAQAMAAQQARIAEARRTYGPDARIAPARDAEQARRGLEFRAAQDLDRIFFRRWRLDGGWLSGAEAERALEVFHDPLARQMRLAVTDRLYPVLGFLRPARDRKPSSPAPPLR